MQAKKKESISTHEIQRQYKAGRRDFSNIVCTGGLLADLDLRGIIFRNAEIKDTVFNGSNLNDSDFSGAKLNLCGLRLTKLKRAKFVGARLFFGSFQLAEFEKTDMRNADISTWNFEGTERFNVDFEGASLQKIWWSYDDMSFTDIEEIINTIRSSGMPMDAMLFLLKRFEDMKKEKMQSLNIDVSAKPKNVYEKPEAFARDVSAQGSYGSRGEYGGNIGGNYTSKTSYGNKRLKTLKETLEERAGKK